MPEPAAVSPVARKYLRLHLCPDVGPIRFGNLLRHLGSIDAVLEAGHQALTRVEQIGPKIAENIIRNRAEIDADAEIELAARHGVRIVCLADEDYPAPLRNIPDPPACLYVRGELRPTDAVALAIVGSRHCSRYGAEQAERLAALGAGAGLTIVSGMARGIDSAAHRGAIAGGGRTIAVMGCGLAHLYPADGAELAQQILEAGAVVSELPMRTAPDATNFPLRNRIIAGLSLGVLVAEAARRSGALITARLASEYNREVFALPGRVDAPYAQGCHELIKTGAAKLVTCLGDILEELGEVGRALMPGPVEGPPADPAPAGVKLDEREARVIEAIGDEPLPLEAICEASGMEPAVVAAALTRLQLKSLVRRRPGDLYERA